MWTPREQYPRHTWAMIRRNRSKARIPHSGIRHPLHCTECGRGRNEPANINYLGGECVIRDTPCNMQPPHEGCRTCEGLLVICANCGNIPDNCPHTLKGTFARSPCPSCSPLDNTPTETE